MSVKLGTSLKDAGDDHQRHHVSPQDIRLAFIPTGPGTIEISLTAKSSHGLISTVSDGLAQG